MLWEHLSMLKTQAKPPQGSEHAGFDPKHPTAQMLNSAGHDKKPHTNLLLLGVHLYFIFFPTETGGGATFLPHHLSPAWTLMWLIHLPLLYLLKEQMGKFPFWIFLNNTRDISDGLGRTYCPWETEVESILWNRKDQSHHYEELPQNFFKLWCLCYLLIQSEQ